MMTFGHDFSPDIFCLFVCLFVTLIMLMTLMIADICFDFDILYDDFHNFVDDFF